MKQRDAAIDSMRHNAAVNLVLGILAIVFIGIPINSANFDHQAVLNQKRTQYMVQSVAVDTLRDSFVDLTQQPRNVSGIDQCNA
jgi:hypothetical protein